MSHAVSYITIREQLDKSRAYDCNICPHSSPDLDLARAHYAAHVSGPELLAAFKPLTERAERFGDEGPPDESWKSDEFMAEMAAAEAAIAKAEPKG